MSSSEEYRLKKETWKRALTELPTKEVCWHLALSALPDTRKEAIVEGSLIVGSSIVTYVVTGALTPALAVAGGALATIAAYNMYNKDAEELKEIVSRITTYKKKEG